MRNNFSCYEHHDDTAVPIPVRAVEQMYTYASNEASRVQIAPLELHQALHSAWKSYPCRNEIQYAQYTCSSTYGHCLTFRQKDWLKPGRALCLTASPELRFRLALAIGEHKALYHMDVTCLIKEVRAARKETRCIMGIHDKPSNDRKEG